MAKTFYKYGERQPITYVDWSEVGRNFTDMLEGQVAARESKKAEIKKTMDEQMEFIQDNPLGGITANDKFSFNLAQAGQEWHTMVNKNMQSGLINYNDAMFLTQNTTKQTERFYNTIKTYNERSKEIEDDIASGNPKISNLTKGQLMTIEGLNRFDDLMPMIDMQGNINASTYDIVDGKQVTKDSYTVKQLELFTNSNIGIFDASGVSKGIADSFGTLTVSKFKDALYGGGMGVTITEINNYSNAQLKERFNLSGSEVDEFRDYATLYLKAEEDKIKAFMNPVNKGSFLVDSLEAEGYQTTTNLKEFESQGKDGKLVFAQGTDIRTTEEQDRIMMEKMKGLVRTATDKTIKAQATSRKPIPKTVKTPTGPVFDIKDYINQGKLYTGAASQQELNSELQYIENQHNDKALSDRNLPTVKLTRDNTGVYAIYSDGTTQDFPFFDANGGAMGLLNWNQQFHQAFGVGEVPDNINQLYQDYGYSIVGGDLPSEWNKAVGGFEFELNPEEEYNRTIEAIASKGIRVSDVEKEQVANNIVEQYRGLGVENISIPAITKQDARKNLEAQKIKNPTSEQIEAYRKGTIEYNGKLYELGTTDMEKLTNEIISDLVSSQFGSDGQTVDLKQATILKMNQQKNLDEKRQLQKAKREIDAMMAKRAALRGTKKQGAAAGDSILMKE